MKMLSSKRSKIPPEGLFCNYSHRVCMQNRLDGYEYCIRHILEDKTAPFKQCTYVYPKNGKRCTSATYKGDKKEGYCQEHIKKAASLQQKIIKRYKIMETPESLLEELDCGLSEEGREMGTKMLEEFLTDSESDKESPVIDQAWHGDENSDAESIDSEQEDVLKHAGVYTAEEVALITRDKLIRLQSLYIEQFKHLQHVLKENRRKYLHALKKEKETMGSIHAMPKTTPEIVQQYEKLKALNHYHRHHGVELLLHNQAKERRLNVTDGVSHKPHHFNRCIQVVKGERCNNRVIPLSKYCSKHILSDPHQVLFRPCNAKKNASICRHPIIPAVDGSNCVLHLSLPPFPTINKSSETTTTVEESSGQIVAATMDEILPPVIPEENPEICQEMSEVELPAESLALFPSELLVLQQPSPETDVEK